jgi:RNA polymerase sigma-70 factor (ECF subfamily)
MARARGPSWSIESLASGSGEALRHLYDALGPALYRTALRVTGSPQDAEDVVHDLFVGLPELLGRYKEHGKFEAWLRRVVVRMCLMRLRQGRSRATVSVDLVDLAVDSGQAQHDVAADLERALGSLPVSLRTVFVLKQLEGYSHDEIAQFTNISAGASRVRYSRALERLRQLLER